MAAGSITTTWPSHAPIILQSGCFAIVGMLVVDARLQMLRLCCVCSG